MAYRIRVSTNAEAELDEAIAWYEEQKSGLGISMLNQFYETMRIIQEKPELFPLVHKNFRRALLKQFPFAIFYAFEKDMDQIIILSVWHTSQNPGRLKAKLK